MRMLMRTDLPDSASPRGARSLVIFFVLTYAVAWAFWLPVVRASAPLTPLHSALALAGTFAPSVVALTLTSLSQGRSGVRALLEPMLQWRVSTRWYLFAASYIAVVKIVAAVLHRIVTGAWPQFGDENLFVMIAATLVSTPMQLGEEVGWRGYALPRLAQHINYGPAALALGVVWACWHLPLFFVVAGDKYGQSFPI